MKRYTLLTILAIATSLMSHAQITIGGDVYGGGKQGAVNIGNATKTVTVVKYTADEASSYNTTNAVAIAAGTLTAVAEGDIKSVSGKENVTLTSTTSDATSVTLTEDAVVRTVFGGGMNGRCYGQTNVTVEDGKIGGEINGTDWTGTIHGGVFGAGDGSTAWVFGKENKVLIKGGTIYNNVYGGGNQADLMGCTNVTLQDGTYYGSVFGGARMANIYGHSFVKLDGQYVPDNTTLIVPTVYGGNDIAGTIATSDSWDWTKATNIDLTNIPITVNNETYASALGKPINGSWNAFVASTYKDATTNNIFVGNLYGGGNGDYTYTDGTVTMIDTPEVPASADYQAAVYYTQEEIDAAKAIINAEGYVTGTNTDAELTATKSTTDVKTAQVGTAKQEQTTKVFTGLSKPELAKDYLNLQGGTFGYVYGGGNNATVTESVDMLVWNAHFDWTNNSTPVMASIPSSRIDEMGVQKSMFTITGEGDAAVATPSYQIDRIFGGNNKAEMSIQPHWYLAQGTFNNIYSGGNKGDMTCSNGILVNIGSRSVFANNVYGGCRMADVRPKDASGNTLTTITAKELPALKVKYTGAGAFAGLDNSTYTFEQDYSARVYITEGHINNVYGGNDISGRVYLGSNVSIAGAISGNVYGGGNGSYAYTDNATLGKTTEYADLYYEPGSSSIDALNAKRPHVDNTLVHIWGDDENQQPKIDETTGLITAVKADGTASTEQPVIVTGGVYCGGNSAAIESTSTLTSTATFKIGKNVVINSVFMGSNGENMVTEDILKTHAGSVSVNGVDYDYSSFDLTNSDTFKKYMKGCAVNILPTITFDWSTGENPHTYIGSLYGGGNVGSQTYAQPITLNMPEGLIIYDRIVGGCNNADVAASTYNAAFEGGVITENSDATKAKITINMDSQLEPRELTPTMTNGFISSALLYWDVRNYYGLNSSNEKKSVFVDDAGTTVPYASVPWLPYGANVFGGCYTSGHIAGDVQINVTKDIVSQAMLKKDGPMTASLSTACNAPENWVHLGEYVFAKTMTIYGGGYGTKTYIAGDTKINLSGAARVINVLGGGDYGTIGCAKTDLHDAHTGNCYVTVAKDMTDYATVNADKNVDANDTHLPYNVTKIYGGAYAGTIYGHTELRLNGGSYQQAYAGSCNADIADYASLYLGTKETANSGYPYVYLYAFGGNDFGGYIGRDGSDNTKTALLAGSDFGESIKGYHDFTSTDGQAGYGDKTIRTTRYVEYNSGRVGYQYDADKGTFNVGTGEGNFLTEAGSKRSSIYGGSYGSYDYSLKYIAWNYLKDPSGENLQTDFDPANMTDFHYPLMKEYIPEGNDANSKPVFVTNTYVNVPCASTDVKADVIQRGILAGGRGIMEQTGIVDAKQTYVYLHGANWQSRNANLSSDIYGGGYYSIVENTKVDAKTGCTNIIYGGSYGTSAKNLQSNNLLRIDFNSTSTEVNLYDGMDNSNMTIFGGGGYAGSTTTNVNLYGGKAANVYGGSYNEGYCATTNVNVPDATNTVTGTASTASVNAIFGGGYGNDVTLPCDEDVTNVTFASADALVSGGVIYGGNNAKRAAKTTNVTINVPAKKSATEYVSVFGAGNGASTIAGYTNVTLNNSAVVNNVYGGGQDGKVFAYYKNIGEGARTYYDNITSEENYDSDPTAEKRNGHGYAAWKWPSTDDGNNTKITINQGATAQNIYGGGYGKDATVAGSTSVYNLGGTVANNIFGGGYSGNVLYQQAEEKNGDEVLATMPTAYNDTQKKNIYTSIYHKGGTVNNIYGGGLDGNVGSAHDMTGSPAYTYVNIGEEQDVDNYYTGCPIVLRSVYGGGYRGAILGTANVNMNNGYIGYDFTASSDADEAAAGVGTYTERLKRDADDQNNLLKESGNIFGGGYGEGATTDHTIVNMYDGTIRNSVYGGGEIASVGVAEIGSINVTNRAQIPNITVAGTTEVNMYGGLVSANVFGGGRGYAIDAYGRTTTGEVGYSDGYTFGKTNVNIYRGTVGTDATVAEGYGNVFGGGNIGYVYGADKTANNASGYKNVTKDATDGYYHLVGGSGLMSEDSKVVVTPVCKAIAAGTVNGVTYKKGDIVSHSALDAITDVKAWDNSVFGDLDKQGVIIRNAVFAGGNVSAGSDKVYANAKTIYGNATASIIDCFQKDLVTIGADEIGGLYGDGNLTFVDGYRELNITNYGTDYYNLGNNITYAEYQKLSGRERAYFELRYACIEAYDSYKLNDQITDAEYSTLSDADKAHWVQKGFCTLYAGRMMNTIQRADFCGVFGSRMVLKGAQDRVPSIVDYTKYTLNRIGELSLNQKTQSGMTNGNYFGIYNVVNYLGALTSDVTFTDTRESDNTVYPGDGSTTYFQWKTDKLTTRQRNIATSKNKVALASGVWLELVKQTATGNTTTDKDVYGIYSYTKDEKIYGPITGIVELDLVNAATGEGGGYVYALNEHGEQQASGAVQTTLTSSNTNAVSYKQYKYAAMSSTTKMETTGNFVNSIKTIIDDCYPYNGVWLSTATPTSKAHYWFIKGNYYVYDQYISAYTGAAQAYAESVNVPLTITAEAQGKLLLKNVQQNLNAYWNDTKYAALKAADSKYIDESDPSVIIINGTTYSKNTPISYWDWAHLTSFEQQYFTTGTYVCNVAIGSYKKGQAFDSTDYDAALESLKDTNGDYKYLVQSAITGTDYKAGDVITKTQYDALSSDKQGQCLIASKCFNVTNAVTSENGFLLTYDWDNPEAWSDYYISPSGHLPENMVLATKKTAAQDSYIASPTYHCLNDAGTKTIYGQTSYAAGDLIDKTAYDKEPSTEGVSGVATQATFETAYVAKDDCKITITDGAGNSTDYNYVKGAAISTTFYNNSLSTEQKALFDVGYTCIQTYQVSDDKYYINGDIITKDIYDALPATAKEQNFSAAYICTSGGAWGGQLYVGGQNYKALDICSLSDTERKKFSYNLDAFETLIANSTEQSPTDVTAYTTSGTYQGLSNYSTRHDGLYAKSTSIDYTAVYTGTDPVTVTIDGASKTLTNGDEITREQFEALANERANYSAITAKATDTNTNYYVVNSEFWVGDTWYSIGSTVSEAVYGTLSTENQGKITSIAASTLRPSTGEQTYYYCKNAYKAATDITSPTIGTSTTAGNTVAAGTVITNSVYDGLKNDQKDFEINGTVPTETSTLYVDSHVGIDDLNEDKIVTAIYEYSYVEANESGTAYETVKERHVVNIHIHFESGVPTVGELLAPPAVLPGNVVGLNQPSVSKGAYEILGGGWEIYKNDEDAQAHKNGSEYTNNNTKMYWYENGYQVAYYAKSYLGKTYSNSVPITVANYHRMSEVMDNSGDSDGDGKADYMYLDEAAKNTLLRDSKVYIKDAAELNQLSQFFDLAKTGAAATSTSTGFENIKNCNRIDFILDGDVNHTATWSSLGDDTHCFSGDFHGDGHTISGLDNALFNYLCGNIYNTGVTGSYTGAGISNHLDTDSKAVNCWTATTETITDGTYPIVGDGTGTATNCYYYDVNKYNTAAVSGWTVHDKSLQQFLDGEVAFNLNGHYLNKRYEDTQATSEGNVNDVHQCFKITDATTTPVTLTLKTNYLSGADSYVESRYNNEDFIYADGTIPVNDNIRKYQGLYHPIYPDDYIYFGQKLAYNVFSGTTHSEHPEAVKRATNADDETLNTKLLVTDDNANRVYRAPAYYKSKEMSTAYFNKPAAFQDAYTLATDNVYGATGSNEVYKKMTAIDFTGCGDKGYDHKTDQGEFYTPFLDYEGLSAFGTSGITRNLLVYADPTNDASSYSVLNTALPEATLSVDYDGYNSVAVPTDAASVKGHLIDKTESGYTATRDHYLVDKEVFNCPIIYTFGKYYKNNTLNCYMWYQRKPDNYVSASSGWEAISLPFTADLVSTQTKGEITHFYQSSTTGHEYWLREFTDTDPKTETVEGVEVIKTYAKFDPIASSTNSSDVKVDKNTFLWDYYYSHDDGASDGIDKDHNQDEYQKLYYNSDRTYNNYPFYKAAKPYIIGFPGSRYYEFDLSGSFVPAHRYNDNIDALESQTISFVSPAGTTIYVSDDELTAVTEDNYSYVPNYMNDEIAAGRYVLNGTGSSFDKTTATQSAVPFRPYFKYVPSGAKTRAAGSDDVDALYITGVSFNKGIAENEGLNGQLSIYAAKRSIIVESGLTEPTEVTIHTAGGVLVKSFTIEPGEKIITDVPSNTIYIVNKKKLLVR